MSFADNKTEELPLCERDYCNHIVNGKRCGAYIVAISDCLPPTYICKNKHSYQYERDIEEAKNLIREDNSLEVVVSLRQ